MALTGNKNLPLLWPFPVALFAQPTTGHNAVQVWVQVKLLPPGVQYADHTSLRAQVFWVLPKGVERAPRCCKEAIVNSFRLMHGQLIELRWKCKYHMKVRYAEQFPLPRRYPFFTLVSLTFWAMAIPATVVAHLQSTTGCASIFMTTHLRCAATLQCAKCTQLPSIDALHSGTFSQCALSTSATSYVGRIIRLCKAAPAD